MREAVGSSLLMYLIIPIIVLFIIFIAFIINYASAYRSANYVVTQIETCQANMSNCDHTSFDKIKKDVRDKYHYLDTIDYSCRTNDKGAVYGVTLKVTFELPLIGKVGVYNVKSETKTMYGAKCNEVI